MMTRWHRRDISVTAQAMAVGAEPLRTAAGRLRDRAIVCAVRDGLTTGQVAALDVGDLNVEAGVLEARSPRAKYRMVMEVGAETLEALRRWLAVRGMVANGSKALFITLHTTPAHARPGGRMGRRSVRAVLERLSECSPSSPTLLPYREKGVNG